LENSLFCGGRAFHGKSHGADDFDTFVGSRAVGAARWHCVRYVMAITEKRFSLPKCAKRTAHS
jgi:hypothetical protein